MDKDLLFYSNFDDYCKQILGIVKKNNIKDLVPICIDDSKIKIPSFIQVVPTIYISKSKKIMIDDEIHDYVKNKIKNDNKGIDNLNGFSSISFSNDYHDIDLNNHDNDDNNLSSFFSDINSMNNTEKLDEQTILENRANNIDSLQKSRQSDISDLFNNNNILS